MISRGVTLLAIACATANGGALVDSYAARLDQLDATRPESVCTARDVLRQLLPAASGSEEGAALFRAFVKFGTQSQIDSRNNFQQAFQPVGDRVGQLLDAANFSFLRSASAFLREKKDSAINRAIGPWLDCGSTLYTDEGSWGATFDPAFELEFLPFLTPGLQAWVRFSAAEEGKILEDAGLVITRRELAGKLKRAEDFARAWPDLKETESDVKPSVRELANLLFIGIDNSHVTLSDKGDVDPEALAAWEWFAGASPDSQYSATVRRLLRRLKETGNVLTPADFEWLWEALH